MTMLFERPTAVRADALMWPIRYVSTIWTVMFRSCSPIEGMASRMTSARIAGPRRHRAALAHAIEARPCVRLRSTRHPESSPPVGEVPGRPGGLPGTVVLSIIPALVDRATRRRAVQFSPQGASEPILGRSSRPGAPMSPVRSAHCRRRPSSPRAAPGSVEPVSSLVSAALPSVGPARRGSPSPTARNSRRTPSRGDRRGAAGLCRAREGTPIRAFSEVTGAWPPDAHAAGADASPRRHRASRTWTPRGHAKQGAGHRRAWPGADTSRPRLYGDPRPARRRGGHHRDRPRRARGGRAEPWSEVAVARTSARWWAPRRGGQAFPGGV